MTTAGFIGFNNCIDDNIYKCQQLQELRENKSQQIFEQNYSGIKYQNIAQNCNKFLLSSLLSYIATQIKLINSTEAYNKEQFVEFFFNELYKLLTHQLKCIINLYEDISDNDVVIIAYEFYCIRSALNINNSFALDNIECDVRKKIHNLCNNENEDCIHELVNIYYRLNARLDLLLLNIEEKSNSLKLITNKLKNNNNTPKTFLRLLAKHDNLYDNTYINNFNQLVNNYSYKLTISLKILLDRFLLNANNPEKSLNNINFTINVLEDAINQLNICRKHTYIDWTNNIYEIKKSFYNLITAREYDVNLNKKNDMNTRINRSKKILEQQEVESSTCININKSEETNNSFQYDEESNFNKNFDANNRNKHNINSYRNSIISMETKKHYINNFLSIYGTRSNKFFIYLLKTICNQLRKSIRLGKALSAEVQSAYLLICELEDNENMKLCADYYKCKDIITHLYNGPYVYGKSKVYVLPRYGWQDNYEQTNSDGSAINSSTSDFNEASSSSETIIVDNNINSEIPDEDLFISDIILCNLNSNYPNMNDSNKAANSYTLSDMSDTNVDVSYMLPRQPDAENRMHICSECKYSEENHSKILLSKYIGPVYYTYQNENEFKTFTLSNRLSRVTVKLYDDNGKSKEKYVHLDLISAEVLLQLQNCIKNNIPFESHIKSIGISTTYYSQTIDKLINIGIIKYENNKYEIIL